MARLILLDIDGCITAGKGESIDLLHLQQLRTCIARHTSEGITGLCTGRSAPYVEAIAQMLNLRAWCICENGAYLYHSGSEERLYHPSLDSTVLSHLAEIRHLLTTSKVWQAVARLELGKEVCLSLNPIGISVEALCDAIRTRLDVQGLQISHSASAVDITPILIDKGTALLWLCEYLGQSLDNVVGIGDSQGDIAFLKHCGMVACPVNAIDTIKSMAAFISKRHSTAGLVDIYHYLFTNNT